ncbi:DUF922 domain-containing protein [Aquicoccus sp. SU-CL01552]|uniref:DUF922 domain-containing protein n=1 Tax=Aquicoccus sp. SU-CL01552 TaxID=3127656 RepID=UPI003103D4F1
MKVTLKIPKPASNKWTVKGKTIEDLFKNLKKHKWWGRYRSHSECSYKKKDGVVSDFILKAKPEIIMPVWANYSKASKEEKKSWDDMWKALKKHEENHHVIFKKEAEAWKKAMEKAGDLDEAKVIKAWNKFGKEAQGKQDAYDKKSDHGIKEGVILNQV